MRAEDNVRLPPSPPTRMKHRPPPSPLITKGERMRSSCSTLGIALRRSKCFMMSFWPSQSCNGHCPSPPRSWVVMVLMGR
jgi:hypothetical protein